ncbi:40S ribosomal protein S5-like protein, partial [Tanacetum coccineum]
VSDLSVEDYITATASKHPIYMPHTTRRNNGKNLLDVCIIKHAMEIIHLLNDVNPVQIIVDDVINSNVHIISNPVGQREDATRIGSAGVVRRQAVDISPLRRVNQAIYLLTTGIARELQNQIEQDYEICPTIRDKVIPPAVSWFTGEAVKEDEFEVEEEEEDDDDEEEDEEDEEQKENKALCVKEGKHPKRCPWRRRTTSRMQATIAPGDAK